MDHTFSKNLPYLPTEIITNILSRLPIRTIISCKCVCKSWFELLKTSEFIKIHLSKSVPGLIIYQDEFPWQFFKIFEFQDELELEQHELHYVPITDFERTAFITPPHAGIIMEGSANGLLFLRDLHPRPHVLYICNPITREYISIPNQDGSFYYPTVVTYGFGVSKISDQYKVVRILHDRVIDQETGSLLHIPKSECHVYTLGTGSWRSVPLDSCHEYNCRSKSAFLNGNLHWLVSDLKESLLISCFNLETERFEAFSPPYLQGRGRILGDLAVLEDQLCFCDNSSDTEIVIWVMKEYWVEESWTKEVVISKLPDRAGESYEVVYPIKVFKDGDILLFWAEFLLLYYSNNTKTTSDIDKFDRVDARLHVSSFLSLKSFSIENVAKF